MSETSDSEEHQEILYDALADDEWDEDRNEGGFIDFMADNDDPDILGDLKSIIVLMREVPAKILEFKKELETLLSGRTLEAWSKVTKSITDFDSWMKEHQIEFKLKTEMLQ